MVVMYASFPGSEGTVAHGQTFGIGVKNDQTTFSLSDKRDHPEIAERACADALIRLCCLIDKRIDGGRDAL